MIEKTGHFVGRIDQIDAKELDDEIDQHVSSQIKEVFKYPPLDWHHKVGPEVEAGFKLLLVYLTTIKTGASVGQKFLSFEYMKSSKWRLIVLSVSGTLLHYVSQRSSMLRFGESKMLDHVKAVAQVLSIANLLVFLQEGKYPSLKSRILCVESMRSPRYSGRVIGYEYLSREVLWHSLMELLTFILPLINVHKIKNYIGKLGFKEKNQKAKVVKYQGQCTFCQQSPVLASSGGCDHIICHFCLTANLKADPDFSCPLCNSRLSSKLVKPIK